MKLWILLFMASSVFCGPYFDLNAGILGEDFKAGGQAGFFKSGFTHALKAGVGAGAFLRGDACFVGESYLFYKLFGVGSDVIVEYRKKEVVWSFLIGPSVVFERGRRYGLKFLYDPNNQKLFFGSSLIWEME